MAQEEYIHWPTNQDVSLLLSLVDEDGAGVTGKIPEIGIRRHKALEGGLLDQKWWDPNTDTFTDTPTWIPLSEYDATNNPGLYTYLWEQSKIGIERVYIVAYRHTVDPIGNAYEMHVITNEVYVPKTQPDPIIFGPDSIMGQLQLMKDGGLDTFDPDLHSMAATGDNILRAMGLLHHNAMADNQIYDNNGQLTSARLRVFDTVANVPTSPGGSETVGLLHEYAVSATYAGLNNLTSYVIKRVT
jgi:hypothetical protein